MLFRFLMPVVGVVASLHSLAFSEDIAPAEPTAPQASGEKGAEAQIPPGRSRYWQRFSAYEPTYLLYEPFPHADRKRNVKLQFSFAFQLLGTAEEPGDGDDRADGLYITFTQTSFWDVESDSKPFLDSNYRPDTFWHQGFKPGLFGSEGLALEGGIGHSSNGQDGLDSRSYNVAFVRPVVRWDLSDSVWLRMSPRFHAYIEKEENPDIARYRGYVDFDSTLGIRDGFAINFNGLVGSEWDRGQIELGLSYPLDEISHGWLHGYGYMQTLWGWSENLLNYDERIGQPRLLFGLALTR